MIVRAEAPGSLDLTVSQNGSHSIDADFRLERIASPPPAPVKPRSALRATRPKPTVNSSISVLAHVSRRGDVIAEAGEWICGPELPLPIEGVEIHWLDRPDNVELSYSVVSSRLGQKRMASAGRFAGTRGKAAPLVSLEMSLTGRGSAAYQLKAEALFLGAAIVTQSGRKVSFAGPSGREPLVGVRLEIVKAHNNSVTKNKTANILPPKHQRKVRVYRSAAAAAPDDKVRSRADDSNK